MKMWSSSGGRGFWLGVALGLGVMPVWADEVLVRFDLELGQVVVAVDADRAPVSAANFLRHVDGGHYDGASFYRTVTLENDNGSPKIEVIQGGVGNDVEPPFPPISHETTETTGLRHEDGTLSMARGEVGTASSEFFICIGEQPGLDFGAGRHADGQGFAAFGRVVSGMEVVHLVHQLPSDGPADNAYVEGQIIEQPAVILTARRVEATPP